MKPKARNKTQVSTEPFDQTVLQFWSLHFFANMCFQFTLFLLHLQFFLMKCIALNCFVQLI